MELEFGKWYNIEIDGKELNCQFIHHDNDTECTIDIEGRWKHVTTDDLKPFNNLAIEKPNH